MSVRRAAVSVGPAWLWGVLMPAVFAAAVGCGGGSEEIPAPLDDAGADTFGEDTSGADTGAGTDTSGDDTGGGGDATDGGDDTSGGDTGGDGTTEGGVVSIIVTPTTGLKTTEAGGTATFTVQLGAAPTANVTIALSSSNPLEGTPSATSVEFTPEDWAAPKTITVTGVDDTVVDGTQGYKIVTAAAVSTDTRYAGVDAADVELVNEDDDKAGIVVTPTSGLITTEAGGSATFTVRLGSKPTASVTIGLTSDKPTEGTPSPITLTFTPDNFAAPQTVTVKGVDDAVADGNQTYKIVTAPATSTDTAYNGLNADDVSVTNVDNESAGITVTPTTGLSTTEAGGTATFTVVLNSQPTANVTIPLTSSDTGEGTVSPASLTFTTTNWNAPQTVTVRGVDDSVADGDQTYTIVTGAATSTDSRYAGVNAADVTVVNRDNESPGFIVTPTSGLVVSESGTSANFTIRLTTRPTAPVTVSFSSSRPTEGTVSPASITFDAANWDSPLPIAVTGVDDAIYDMNQVWFARTAPAVSTDPAYNGMDPPDVQVTTIDNESAGVTITPANTATTRLVTTEAGGTATFTVVLNSAPTVDVTVPLRSSNSAEGEISINGTTFAATQNLVFTNANWNVPRTVTLRGVDDLVQDGNQLWEVITDPLVSGDSGYSGHNPSDVFATNTDNDTAGISICASPLLPCVAPVGLTTTESLGTATFYAVLNSKPTANLTVTSVSSLTTEGVVTAGGTLTFTTTDYNNPAAHAVTVTGVNDDVDDGDKGYSVTLTATSGAAEYLAPAKTASVDLTNIDNDTAGITVAPVAITSWPNHSTTESGNVAKYSVRLDTKPTGNVTVTATSSNANEGYFGALATPSATTTLTFTESNWNVPQEITVTGRDDVGTVTFSDDAFTLSFSASGGGYAGVSATPVNVTNYNNDVDTTEDPDLALIMVDPSTGLATSERGVASSFSVSLGLMPLAPVTVRVTNETPTEITLGASEIVDAVLTSADWDIGVPVSVTGKADGSHLVPATLGSTLTDDVFNLTTAAATSVDLRFNGYDAPNVSGINYDYNTTVILVRIVSGRGFLRVTEGASPTTDTFEIWANVPPLADVTVPLSIGGVGANRAEVLSSSVVLPAATTNRQVVTVRAKNDGITTGNRKFKKFTVTTGNPSSTDPGYNGGSKNPADVAGRAFQTPGF